MVRYETKIVFYETVSCSCGPRSKPVQQDFYYMGSWTSVVYQSNYRNKY